MNVILIGSGRFANEIKQTDLSGHTIVTMNNAWKLYPDFDYAIYANDMAKEHRPVKKRENQQLVTGLVGPRLDDRPIAQYNEKGYLKCRKEMEALGYPVPLTTLTVSGFWCLWYLQPKLLGFIGCDMDYTPDENGHTHFYGVGHDIQKRGIPDPFLRRSKEEIMESLVKMEEYATSIGAELVNYSSNPHTILPFKRRRINEN